MQKALVVHCRLWDKLRAADVVAARQQGITDMSVTCNANAKASLRAELNALVAAYRGEVTVCAAGKRAITRINPARIPYTILHRDAGVYLVILCDHNSTRQSVLFRSKQYASARAFLVSHFVA